MKNLKMLFSLFIIISLVIAISHSIGYSEGTIEKNDPINDEWNMMDLLFARPLGVAAGIIGTGVFILSLPFTIPTESVEKAADMFIVKPFEFSFVRKFPDENF